MRTLKSDYKQTSEFAEKIKQIFFEIDEPTRFEGVHQIAHVIKELDVRLDPIKKGYEAFVIWYRTPVHGTLANHLRRRRYSGRTPASAMEGLLIEMRQWKKERRGMNK